MRSWVMAIVLAGVSGAAQAGDPERADGREYDSSSFAAQAYYRFEFGGARARTPGAQVPDLRHSLGFRVDNERAASWGAPAVLRLQFGAHDVDTRGPGGFGLQTVALNGLDLRGIVSLNQGEGTGFFENLTVPQWFALGLATVITTSIVVDAADSGTKTTTASPSGTGATP